MTTLILTGITDYRGLDISGVDSLQFSGTSGIVIAQFSEVQFGSLTASTYLSVLGSAAQDVFILDAMVRAGTENHINLIFNSQNWGPEDIFVLNGTDKNDLVDLGLGFGSVIFNGGDGDDSGLGTEGGHCTFNGGDGNDGFLARGDGNILHGGDGRDELRGADGRDEIHGGAGTDTIGDDEDYNDNDVSDILDGGGGDDYISSGGGADVIDGGAGFDIFTANWANKTQDLVINISRGGMSHDIGDGTRLSNIELLHLADMGMGDDRITGGQFEDQIYGGGGNNVLRGMGGADKLVGNSVVHFSQDILRGGSGGDTLIGGNESDILTGGTGHDTFVLVESADWPELQQRDVFTDFKQGVDVIKFSTVGSGDDTEVHCIGQDAFSGGAIEARFRYTAGGNTLVEINVGNLETIEFKIKLLGKIELTDSDFIL